MKGVIDFERDPWPRISPEAKEVVQSMLDQNPYSRLSLEEVLGMYSLLFCSLLI